MELTERLIPSRYIRDELSKNGFQLSDADKATMFWNSTLSYTEKLEELQKLSDSTSNENLQKQIRERLDYESKKLERIKDNSSGSYLYVFEDQHKLYQNYFLNYKMSILFAQRYLSKGNFSCTIYKKKLINSCDEFTKTIRLHWNQHTTDELAEAITVFSYGESVSEIQFNNKGNIDYLYCGEMSPKEENDTYEYRKYRFEQNCFAIPIKFSCGTIVRDVTDNSLAVIASDADFSNAPSDDSYFSYFGVPVLTLDKNGMWDHTHIRPIYLEKAEPLICGTDDKKESAYIRAINSFSECLKAGMNDEEPACLKAIADAREYRDICVECAAETEKQIFDHVDKAVRLTDIMN